MAVADSSRLQEAQKLAKTDPRKAEAIYKEITAKAPAATSDAATKEYESALISLGELYRDEKSVTIGMLAARQIHNPISGIVTNPIV